MHVGVVALPGSLDSALASVMDILRVADHLRPSVDPHIPPIAVSVVGMRPTVRTANGFIVEADRDITEAMDDLDVLVVPALRVLSVAAMEEALALPEVGELQAALRDGHAAAVPILAGACTGTYILAEAGRLDGLTATTSWWLSGCFEQRYPAVKLDMMRMVVRDKRVITAGAAFAHLDLAMSLVFDVSPRLAETTTNHLLVDERSAHSVAAVQHHLATSDALVIEFEGQVRERLADDVTIPELADELGVTRRTLERHVRSRTGQTPSEIVRRLRVERAQHLQRTTELSMDQIARRVGYASAVTLSRVLARGT